LMLNRQRTQLSNALRAHLSEFGIVAPIGRGGIEQLLAVINDENDPRVPADARLCLQMLEAQLIVVKAQILENDRRVRASARETELGRRLMEIPGVGPLLASAFVATVADAHAFKSGRCLSAWIGLVPKQNSSGGKEKLGSISKAGNRYLRQMLVVGAMAVIRYAERNGTRRPWLVQLMARRTTKVAAVALANKTARMVWALMTSGERYRGLSACADTTLVLDRDKNGITLYVRGRDVEEKETALKFTAGYWTVIGDAAEVRRTDERTVIVEYLSDNREPITPSDLAVALGWKSNNTKQLLFKMARRGEVLREKGRYALPPSNSDNRDNRSEL
jgi:hypothetical protein